MKNTLENTLCSLLILLTLTNVPCNALVRTVLMPVATSNIEQDIKEIAGLIPFDEINSITSNYITNDPEFRAFAHYIKSNDYIDAISKIYSDQHFQNIAAFIGFANPRLHTTVLDHLDHITDAEFCESSPEGENVKKEGAVTRYFDDVFATLPKKQLSIVMQAKTITDPEFKEMIDKFNSSAFNELYSKFMNCPELQDVFKEFEKKGLNVKKYLNHYLEVISWAKTST